MARVTKREMFMQAAVVLSEAGREDLAEVMDKEVDLLVKRASVPRKATATQLENEDLKAQMLAILETEDSMEATAVANEVGITVQRASQLLRQLKEANLVTKTPAKGKVKAQFAVTE